MRLSGLRSTWAGLTARGTSFLTAGVVAFVCAVLLGQADLVRVAGLLAVLPLAVVVLMASRRLHVSVGRSMEPARGSVGEEVEVRVEVVNRAGRRTPVLLFEDSLPPGLLARTRVVLPPLKPRETGRVAYRARATRRGRFEVGPARLLAVEPFGLVERTWQATSTDELLIRPVVQRLGSVLPTRRMGRGGDSDLGGAGVVGDPDLLVREYRHGDDLRRVHWPTTARRGQLMVRPDQHPQDHNAVVLLDARAEAQRGAGATSTLEVLVSAAASVAAHAAEAGQRVVLLGDGQAPVPGSHDTAHRDQAEVDPVEDALDRLAVLTPTGGTVLIDAVESVPRYTPSLVVALLGEVGPGDVAALAGTAREATRAAVVCDTTTWEQLSPARRRQLQEQREEAVAVLRGTGWRVVELHAGDDLATAWEHLHDRVGASR